MIGENSIVAAGALVAPGKQIPAGSFVVGVPGRVMRQTTPEDQARIAENAEHYKELIPSYLSDDFSPV